MKKKILVLGAGHVGSTIAIDLKNNGHEVSVMDINPEPLSKLPGNDISTLTGDFTSPLLIKYIEEMDLVVGAAPGRFGFQLMKRVIEAGINMVDISFCSEDYLELDGLAREKNVTLIPDIGVAPGICNIILGFHNAHMQVDSYKCVVGGLPIKREWPLEYKASWSPADVIEEYTRPARFKEHGKIITKPALSDNELITIDPVGTLEEWNSDGLRSLLKTLPDVPNMIEKTLRYPGTVEYLKVLRELGYFSDQEINVNGKMIKPLDLSAALLLKSWQPDEKDREFTIMRVTLEGLENNRKVKYIYDLYDEYDKKTDTLSMARTTGYTCSAAANLLITGMYSRKGVCPPEYLGNNDEYFRYVMNYLEERDVNFKITKE